MLFRSSAMAQKAITLPPEIKKAAKEGSKTVKLIIGGGLVVSSLNELKGSFLSEDFAHCMALFNRKSDDIETTGDSGYENSDV